MIHERVTLNQINTFVAVVEYGGFTKAALHLYTSQAAVSHQISSLEETLGVKLFVRQPRQPVLTEQGRCAYRAFKQVSSIVNNLGTSLSGDGQPQETLRIFTTHLLGGYVLPSLLIQFSSRHRNVRLVLSTLTRSSLLAEFRNQPDALVLINTVGVDTPPRVDGVTFARCFKQDIVVVGKKSLGLLKEKTIEVASLCNLPLVSSDLKTWSTPLMARDLLDQATDLKPIIETSDDVTSRLAALNGAGYGLTARFDLGENGEHKDLYVSQLVHQGRPVDCVVWVGWRDGEISPVSRAFIDIVYNRPLS